MGTPLTGEKVKRLRNLCTGETPVHFFQRLSGAALGLVLAAAPLSSAQAAAGPTPAAPRPAGQTADDFYRARNGAPLWLATSAGGHQRGSCGNQVQPTGSPGAAGHAEAADQYRLRAEDAGDGAESIPSV